MTAVSSPPDLAIAINGFLANSRQRWAGWGTRLAGWSVLLLVALAALIAGLVLRRFAWDQTEPIRYVMDIDNAFRQGTMTMQIGFIDRYDEQQTRPDQNAIMALDYAPGRLAIATLWTKWVREKIDGPIEDPKSVHRWPMEFYTLARSKHQSDGLPWQYELCKPMLMVNLTGEILSAVAMFFLVRRYTTGPMLAPLMPRRAARANVLGMIAALFFWFNPALIWNAHCWPQWDSWVLPFFLWGVLLASLDFWFCAGMVMAAGAMFKAQILFGAPLFILWPLFQGRMMAIVRWIIGLMFFAAVLTSVWLVHVPSSVKPLGIAFVPGTFSARAIEWLAYLVLMFAAIAPLILKPREVIARVPAALVLAVVVDWILSAQLGTSFSYVGFLSLAFAAVVLCYRSEDWDFAAKTVSGVVCVLVLLYPAVALFQAPGLRMRGLGIAMEFIAFTVLGLLIAYAPRRALPYTAAAWIAIALWLCVPLFHGSMAWFDRGVAFGTHHYERMSSGDNNNLADLLQTKWSWDDLMAPVITLPRGQTSQSVARFLNSVDPGVHLRPGDAVGLPLKYFLTGLWVCTVVLCAIGTAVHDRRRSPRFLASIAAPWIMFFAVMTQMHQRYLLWGASLSAATAVLSPGYAALHLFLSIVSMSQEMMSMMRNHLDRSNWVDMTDNAAYGFFAGWHPGVSWAVILTACIFVYTAVRWDKPLGTHASASKPRSDLSTLSEEVLAAPDPSQPLH